MGGKGKLAKWAEMKTFNNVVEPTTNEVLRKDHPLKGKWRSEVFMNENPIVLELGCGKGEYTVGMGEHFPNKNFIGVDIKGNRIWRGAKTAYENQMKNVYFIRTQIDHILSFFAKNEVDEIWITFPDPQPKDRLERKRLTSPMFIERYQQFLKASGIIHLKTDHEGFFRYTLEEIERCNFKLLESTFNLYEEVIEKLDPTTQEILSIKTFYEKLFSAKGHSIHYLKFQLH
ncbi:MAG: tRNA (guanosine(46)-N7)-methyltransferase TrmB [Vicingus serpentipes]|nr:tRNA (guanosine(46)-N7)-methyltransferase TrmB [Vicingus serpentipes]